MKLILTSDTHFGHSGKSQGKHVKFWRKVAQSVKDNDTKALIWAGDLASNRLSQFESTIKMAREHLSNLPILVVRGNHDFWSEEGAQSILRINEKHKEIFKKYNVRHLQNNPVELDRTLICGWDGWYGHHEPPTNDPLNMPKMTESVSTHIYMQNEAYKSLFNLLDLDLEKYENVVAVTHFPLVCANILDTFYSGNERYFEFLKDRVDVLCEGHSHRFVDKQVSGVRILNAGSDYDNPKFIIFDV